MSVPQKYPIGIQDFESLRTSGYIYVDKTDIIYNLVSKGAYYFLARPRRFGKSLLLSTLKAYFEGKKELFKGLAIYDLEKDWILYPVLHLSLGTVNSSDPDSVKSSLDRQFSEWEELYGVDNISSDYSARFASIIKNAFVKKGQRVVILVDEYDNPLVNTIHNTELHERNRDLLKSVYSNLKDMGEYIKFGMLTGVSRFSKMSVFSGMNNLNDISLDNQFATICGWTKEELIHYFHEGIKDLVITRGLDHEIALRMLKDHYDGYHFTPESPDIYNPFSILNALYKSEINNYWFATGTPTFLVKELKQQDVDLREFLNQKVQSTTLAEADSAYNSTISLLFQTGYLTIKDYDPRRRRYLLGIPNTEVREGLSQMFLTDFLYPQNERGNNLINTLLDAVEEGHPEDFITTLKAFFAGVPFDLSKGNKEVYFHNAFYILCNLIGLYVKAENHTSQGSIDIVIETPSYVYVIELKLDRPASEAIAQIESKDYALPWSTDNRKIFKIGISFSSDTRNISDWEIR